MRLFSGQSNVENLEQLIEDNKIERIFLVTGKNSYEISGAKKFIEQLGGRAVFIRFCDFENNPNLKDAKTGIKNLLSFNPDAILAIGGGSVIDMAKIINALYKEEEKEFKKIISKNNLTPPFLPMIAIPTTAGSGAEATHFAVVYVDNVKYSISHNLLIPNFVFLNSGLLNTQSNYQLAVSGIDAFSQAIESYWSVNSTDESLSYSLHALKLLWTYLPLVVNSGKDEYFQKVQEGAYLAGKAINIAKTTAPHAFSYGFSTHFGLPHGHAVALTLPYFIKFNSSVNSRNINDPRGCAWVKSRISDISALFNVTVEKLPELVESFIIGLGIETRIAKLDVSYDLFIKVAENVNMQRLSNNPVKFNVQDIKEVYYFNQ